MVKHKVPLVITSLGARPEVNQAVHAYGGYVLHDVINQRFAHGAIDKGADGLVLVAAGAGGHAGALALRLPAETRSGSTGRSRSRAPSRMAAASWRPRRWAPTSPMSAAPSSPRTRRGRSTRIVERGAEDIVYTNLITGVHGNYLKPSLVRAGLDPDNLPTSDPSQMNFGSDRTKRWKDIWGSGQGLAR